jgi:hypothetical protein
MFLTPPDLRELTGYKLPAKQREWLERNGVPHTVNAAGRPVVLVSVLEQMHGVRQDHVAHTVGSTVIDMGKVA